MPQHPAHRLDGQAVFQADGGGESVARGVRTGLGVRRATSLDEQLADLAIEVAVHGKLPKP